MMASWRPKTDFEEEIVSLDPEHNFIYGELTDAQKKLQNRHQSRPPSHLEFMKRKSKGKKQTTDSKAANEEMHYNGLNGIRAVQKMVGTKKLGDTVTMDDLNDIENREAETIAMIRHCGMGATEDTLLDEKTTIPTLPIRDNLHIVKKGGRKFPVIFNDEFFAVESTRQRNAILREKINAVTNGISGVQIDKENSFVDIITVLNEPEVKEPTEAEMAAKDYQEFQTAYPTLGKQKTKSSSNSTGAIPKSKMNAHKIRNNETPHSASKRTQMNNENIKRKSKKSIRSTTMNLDAFQSFERNNFDSSASPSLNSSTRTRSSYQSFENSDSTNSSAYFSANECPSWGFTNESASNARSYAGVLQSNQVSNKTATEQKRYYTPKEVYDRKRQF